MTVAEASQSFSTRRATVSENGNAPSAGTSTVCRASDLGGRNSGRISVTAMPMIIGRVVLSSVFGAKPSASPVGPMCTVTGSGIASQRSRM